jgi:hypothetical protein
VLEPASPGGLTADNFPGATIYVDGVSGGDITDNDWHHVVITDGTGVNATAVDIGRAGSNYFDGILDEVRFYTRELTATEINKLFTVGEIEAFD